MWRAAWLFILISTIVCAQHPPARRKPSKVPAKQQKDSAYWLERAQFLTREIVDQEFRISRYDRAVLEAHLCSLWWQADQIQARRFCAQAGDEVSNIPQNESAEERKQRRIAVDQVLAAAAHRDAAMRQKIIASLQGDNAGLPGEGLDVAETLAQASMNTDSPPESATVLEEAARFGGGPLFVEGLLNLAESDPQKADALFQQALARRDPSFFRQLLEHLLATGPHTMLPEEWGPQVIDALSKTPLQPPAGGDHSNWCDWIGMTEQLAASKDEEGELIAPGLASPELADAKQTCDAQSPVPHMDEANFKTPDDYLAAADHDVSARNRLELKIAAAMHATDSPADYRRALDILDSLTKQEIDSEPGRELYNLRIDFVASGAREAFIRNDPKTALQFLDRAFSGYEAAVEIALLDGSWANRTEMAFGVKDLFARARAHLMELPPADPNDFVRFFNAAVNRKLLDPAIALKEMVDNLNRWRAPDAASLKPGEDPPPAIGSPIAPAAVSSAIDRMDEDSTLAAIRTLEAPKTRMAFELVLLNGYLENARKRRELEGKPARRLVQ